MQRLRLDVNTRESTGKGPARRMRVAGEVPAVLYGTGIEPVSLRIDRRQLERVIHGGANALIDLQGPDSVKGKLVLLKELQREPVKRTPIHVDLLAIDTSKKLHVSVPVHVTGKCKGVELGGVLEPIMREVEVNVLPLNIPDSFDVDVTDLDIGQAVHVSDLVAPEGVEIVADETAVLVHVVTPRVEETPAEDEEAEEAEGETPAEGAAAPEATEGGDGGGN